MFLYRENLPPETNIHENQAPETSFDLDELEMFMSNQMQKTCITGFFILFSISLHQQQQRTSINIYKKHPYYTLLIYMV